MLYFWFIITAILGYLIGSVNFSVLISKKMAGFDVREKGSGNAGTTNVLRSVGKKAAALTLFCDIAKGLIAVLIALLISNKTGVNGSLLCQIAAIEVVAGHTFPVFFGFKGGKGVATSLGIILILNWKIGLICLASALIIIAISRMVSLGSVCAAIIFAILTIFIKTGYIAEGHYLMFGLLLAFIVIFNHRENIKRIIKGKENKISFKKKVDNIESKESKGEK